MTAILERSYSPKRRRRAIAGSIVAIVVAAAVAVGFSVLRGPGAPECSVPLVGGGRYTLDPEQAQNASIVAAVGSRLGMPDHAVTVALAAALQETRLRNLPYGDRDSHGLFQQRPSQGWGTEAQVMDPAYASNAFFEHLMHVPSWQTMDVASAADAVQHSAAPQAYAAWESQAIGLAQSLTGEIPAGLTCHLPTFDGSTPKPGALASAATAQFGRPVLDGSLATKSGWVAASWVVAHAYRYHVSSVAFGGKRWTASSGVWRSDPSAGDVVVVGTV